MIKKLDRKIFFLFYNYTFSSGFLSKSAVFITIYSSKFFSLIYFAAGAWLIYNGDSEIRGFIFMPALVYLQAKVIPHFYNRRRPFAEFGCRNLIKQRRDHSFPSTHTASSLIISLAMFNLNSQLGVLMIITAILTALSRIMTGVHYPSDIIGGWLLALISYFLVPIFF